MRRVCCAVFIAASAALCFFTRSPSSVLLLSASVIFPGVALAAAFFCAGKIDVELTVPDNLEKEKAARCVLSVENRSFIPAAHAELSLSIRNVFTGEEEKIRLNLPSEPGRRKETEFLFQSGCCGRIEFDCDEIRIYDFFGLLGIGRKTAIHETRLIFPKTFPLKVALTGGENPGESSEVTSSFRKGSNLTEPLQIREYAEGDNVRQIHWKLTERTGRYMVLDPSLEMNYALHVLWDGAEIPEGTSPAVPDTLAEVFASVCIALTEAEIPYRAVWREGGDGGVRVREIGDPEDILIVMAAILSAGAETEGNRMTAAEDIGQKIPSVAYFACRINAELEAEKRIEKTTAFICTEGNVSGMKAGSSGKCRIFSPVNYQSVLNRVTI